MLSCAILVQLLDQPLQRRHIRAGGFFGHLRQRVADRPKFIGDDAHFCEGIRDQLFKLITRYMSGEMPVIISTCR